MNIPKQLDRAGFRFIKVVGKRPIEDDWVNTNNYPYNSEVLKSWIDKGNNYGVVCGRAGLVVLDFDTQKAYDDVKDKLPATFTIRTATKKLPHLYYLVDGEPNSFKVTSTDNKTLIDVQGEGKMVVGAGSKIYNNEMLLGSYDVANDLPIAEIKEDYLKKVLGRDKPQSKEIDNSRSGIEFRALLRYIRESIQKYDEPDKDEIFRLMTAYAKWNEQGDAYRQFSWKKALEYIRKEKKENNNSIIKVEPLKLKSLKQIRDEGIPQIDWVVDKILPIKGVSVFGGASGTKKSWVAMSLALGVASGKPFLNKFNTKMLRVLYVDEENGDITIPNRFDRLIRGGGYEASFDNIIISIFNGFKLDTLRGSLMLKKVIEQYNPQVIIIDSMVRCMEGDEDKSTFVRKIFENIKPLFLEYSELCFVIIHHTTKAGQGINSLRGSGDFIAFADTILLFEGRDKGIVVDVVKNRLLEKDEMSKFAVTFTDNPDGGIKLDYTEYKKIAKSEADGCADDIWNWIKNEEKVVFKTKTLKPEIERLGHKNNTLFDALNILIERGKIKRLNKGFYEVLGGGEKVTFEDIG